MEGVHAASGGASATSPTGRPGTGNSYKRKRSGAEFESSPGSGGEGEEDDGNHRRQPGVKRACNECRQQKVSHYPQQLKNWMRLDDEALALAYIVMRLMIYNYSFDAMSSKTPSRLVRDVVD
jgi:hypothetical protein